jgi:hypothetical protein
MRARTLGDALGKAQVNSLRRVGYDAKKGLDRILHTGADGVITRTLRRELSILVPTSTARPTASAASTARARPRFLLRSEAGELIGLFPRGAEPMRLFGAPPAPQSGSAAHPLELVAQLAAGITHGLQEVGPLSSTDSHSV